MSRALKDICHKCDAFKCFSVPPVSFEGFLQNDGGIVSINDISIGVMFFDNDSLSHVVRTVAYFSAATFLDKHAETYSQAVEDIWKGQTSCQLSIYTGCPNRITSDQGSNYITITCT